MAVARPEGFEIDFGRNPISGSAAKFFIIILHFIFTLIFEIKIPEKKFLTPKKFHFRRSISIGQIDIDFIKSKSDSNVTQLFGGQIKWRNGQTDSVDGVKRLKVPSEAMRVSNKRKEK